MKRSAHRQRGAVLIVALLFLVILTMLGVTAMSSTTMEERMAGNTRDMSVALNAAEAALFDAHRDLSEGPPLAGATPRALPKGWSKNENSYGTALNNLGTCNTDRQARGLCSPTVRTGGPGFVPPAVPNHSLTAAPSVQYGQFTGAPALAGVSRQPRYLVEQFCLGGQDSTLGGPSPDCRYMRVIGVGYGANPNTRVLLHEFILLPKT